VIVLIDVVGEDAIHAGACEFEQSVFDEVRVAAIVEDTGELMRETEVFIELPEGEQAGIGAEAGRGGLDDDGAGVEKSEAGLPSRLYNHRGPPFTRF
jgi:hypothetical protein